MFKKLFNFFSSNIIINLNASNTLIYMQGKGIILDEPSIVALAINKSVLGERILAVGQEAMAMLGKTHSQIKIVQPIKNPVLITDFNVTVHMIKHFIKKASTFKHFLTLFRPIILICVPPNLTQVERSVIKKAALASGASRVEIIEETMAAAIGLGVPVNSPRASMIVEIGDDATNIVVISFGSLVYSSSIHIASNSMNEIIINYIRSSHGLLIGTSTARQIKKSIGSAHLSFDNGSMEIRGRSIFDSMPKQITITSKEIRNLLEESLLQIIKSIKCTLRSISLELFADLINDGLILTGSGLLQGLHILISETTQLKTIIAHKPSLCVITGCVIALNDLSTNNMYKLANMD